jgi:hypothetical protein
MISVIHNTTMLMTVIQVDYVHYVMLLVGTEDGSVGASEADDAATGCTPGTIAIGCCCCRWILGARGMAAMQRGQRRFRRRIQSLRHAA